ncbi:MAG TPA: glycosyltransferase [Vicinamibacterales bacterium]|nr:glycosyltransferase [Vicinamibacterales bacterium]
MNYVFWHHDVHGPFTLESVWTATHGFAGSVARLRILFWLAGRGHGVQLIGNVASGEYRGVRATAGENWSDIRLDEHTVAVMLTPPTGEMWERVPSAIRRRMIFWANNPFDPVWIARARAKELLRVVCIAPWHRELYRIYKGFDEVELGFHGIDLDMIAAARPRADAAGAVLFCSVPKRAKGVHRLLAAWRVVQRTMPGARLRIAGSPRMHEPDLRVGVTGILEPEVEAEFPDFFGEWPASAERAGITLLGTRSIPEVASEMKSAALVVVNCNWNGGLELSCSAAVQAQAAGTPVVAPARGGLPDLIVDGRTGLLVKKQDPAAIGDAIVTLLKDASLRKRLGDAGPGFVRPFADYDIVAAEWDAIVERARRGEPAPRQRRFVGDLLRAVGYGRVRSFARNGIRGTAFERAMLKRVAT